MGPRNSSHQDRLLLISPESAFRQAMVERLRLEFPGSELLVYPEFTDSVDDFLCKGAQLILVEYNSANAIFLETVAWAQELMMRSASILFVQEQKLGSSQQCLDIPFHFRAPYEFTTFTVEIRRKWEQAKSQQKQELEEWRIILADFLEEAQDLLIGIEALILKLEESSADSPAFHQLFRRVHTIKGSSGIIDVAKPIKDLFHSFESVLSKFKNNEILLNPEKIDLMMVAVDFVNQAIVEIREHESLSETLQFKMKEHGQRFGLEDVPVLLNAAAFGFFDEGEDASHAYAPVASVVEVASRQHKQKEADTTSKSNNSDETYDEEDGVHVHQSKLDSFVALSGEFIILKNYFRTFKREVQTGALNQSEMEASIGDFHESLSKLTDRLQEQIMEVRKIKLSRALSKIPRIVRSAAKSLGKKVQFVEEGMDLGVDKSIAKAINIAMVHMVRNAIDHGIETPSERLRAGKNDEGHLTLKAYNGKGMIHIMLKDDGRGINPDRVGAKALAQNLVSSEQLATMSEQEIQELIFLPGFSTAETVTDISGRGVGMDAVKATIMSLGGKIHLQSQLGQGTSLTLDIPLPKSVVIEQSIIVRSGPLTLAVPIEALSKISPLAAMAVHNIQGARYCQFQGSTIRIAPISEYLSGVANNQDIWSEASMVLVIHHKDKHMALVVDAIEHILEAVVRPFDNLIAQVQGFKGTTILGTTRIAYVLSPEDLAQLLVKSRDSEL